MEENERVEMEEAVAELKTYTLSLQDMEIPIYEEPELGDKVVLVIFGKVGGKIGDDGIIFPTRALFDMGDFFEGEEVPELSSDADES